METQKQQSVYQIGASDGLVMGAYLCAIFLLQAVGAYSGVLMLIAEVLTLGVPVLAYKLVKRSVDRQAYLPAFSAVWMHGIMTFICGCLIMGLVAYIYMRFVNPAFITNMALSAAELYASLGTPDAKQIAELMHRIIDKHLLPSPISMAFSMMWLGSFLGAMLSLIIAIILKLKKKIR